MLIYLGLFNVLIYVLQIECLFLICKDAQLFANFFWKHEMLLKLIVKLKETVMILFPDKYDFRYIIYIIEYNWKNICCGCIS